MSESSDAKRAQNRQNDGRYDFDGNLDRMCVCGCTLGVHSAGAPHECLAYSLPPDYKQCRCPKFKQSRKRKASNEQESAS